MKRMLGIALILAVIGSIGITAQRPARFHLQEATIADIQQAIQKKQFTTVGLVELYLQRIKAYNGTCVNEPQGILGPVTTIPNAGQINALSTLNLRPAARAKWGFDARKARSLTDPGRQRRRTCPTRWKWPRRRTASSRARAGLPVRSTAS